MRRREYLVGLTAIGLTSGCLNNPTDPLPAGGGSDQDSTPTRSPTPTASPTPTPTDTPTPTATPSIAAIDEDALEQAILDAVFEARGSTVTRRGTLVDTLNEMANYHTDRMAEVRTVAHVIDGETTADRYEMFDLSCRVRNNEGTSLLGPEHLEVVGAVSTRGVTVEEAAQQFVDSWLEEPDSKETLLLENADHVGIGVTIVTGRAYATIVFC